MIYKIRWKLNKQIYTEYKNITETKSLLDWLEANYDNGVELVSITLNEE